MTKLSRRGAFGAALAAATLPAVTLTASADPSPDAELIRICAGHAAHIAAVNDRERPDEPEAGPIWTAYERSRDAIHAAVPLTLAGMVAKAQAAKAEALGPQGQEDPENCPAATWAWDLVHDLLRLSGTVAFPPAAVAALAPDAQLIADCARYVELEMQSFRLCEAAGGLHDRDPRCVELRRQEALLRPETDDVQERIIASTAHTTEGLRAKARAVFFNMGDGGPNATSPMNDDDYMAWSLVQDMQRGGAA